MGGGFAKAVESVVVKRDGRKQFHVGLAEMNGWRPSMEDSHVIFMEDAWGFFGVFDGHGGSQCSSFVSRRINEELRKGPPDDDAAMKELMLGIDREYLETMQPSGSTGTFVMVREEEHEGKSAYLLRVGNIGDSRVLLGRTDGTMVIGPGTDGGLTTDHKPDNPDERARIERTGGTVEDVMGVARVNGDLAVSRAFGDAQYKVTGGPAQEDHPVSACPEFSRCHCSSADFIVLVCDGISESNFPNSEVVALIAEELAASERPDAGQAAVAVCRRALERGSMDNLSCMIVLLNGAEVPNPSTTLHPGPVSKDVLENATWRRAYAAMAEHAGLSLAAALEMRYDNLLKEPLANASELSTFGSQPASLASGSPERIEWFKEWVQELECEMEAKINRERILPTHVRVGPSSKVRPLVERHPHIKWDDRLFDICGSRGIVEKEDDRDKTAQVSFPEHRFKAWLPFNALGDVIMRVAELEELREAVNANRNLKWKDRLEQTCGKKVRLKEVDTSDDTAEVTTLDEPMTVWLPSSCLSEIIPGEDDDMGEDSSGDDTDSTQAETPRKRPRRSTVGCPEPVASATPDSLQVGLQPTEVASNAAVLHCDVHAEKPSTPPSPEPVMLAERPDANSRAPLEEPQISGMAH